MINVLMYTAITIIWIKLLYHMVLVQGGYRHSLKKQPYTHSLTPLPTVSVFIPAHNEEMVIEKTLRSMTRLNYPKDRLEVILINDHSSDRTGEIGDRFASEYPYIKVIHNRPPYAGKGKSGALNVALKQAKGEMIVVYDADNTPERDAVYQLATTLQKDRKAGAVVGKFRVTNAATNLLTRFINIETITFQWLAQAGRWFWFRLATIPGTNFAIRRSILEQLGGWDERALSEDTELSIRVYHLGYHIRFHPFAITWEQEPETWRVWWKQRTRWARGNMYVIGKYILKFRHLKNKLILIDLIYFLLTYFLFFVSIFISHSIFIVNLFYDLELEIGRVSIALLIAGFLLFVTEVCLALSIEEQQLTVRNFFTVLLMYITYSQMWLILILNASFLEAKRVIFQQEVKWYKTERFKEKPAKRDAS